MACSLLEDNALDEEGEYAEGLQVQSLVKQATGEASEAEELASRAMVIATLSYGEWHTKTAVACSSLGDILRAKGKHADALKLSVRAVQIEEAVSGRHLTAYAAALYSYAACLSNMGRVDDSIKASLAASKICTDHFGQDSQRSVRCLENLRVAYSRSGQEREAGQVAAIVEGLSHEYTVTLVRAQLVEGPGCT